MSDTRQRHLSCVNNTHRWSIKSQVRFVRGNLNESVAGSKVSKEKGWEKPNPEFPLSYHPPSCRLYKKIRGKRYYFGYAANWQAALDKYLAEKDYLHAGRTPPENLDGLTVGDLCNRFLTSKRHLLDTGELSERSFRDYYVTCEKIVAVLNRGRIVDDLAPPDFENLRNCLAKNRGPVALGNEIGRARMVFKFADDNALIERPVRYGQGFRKPSKKTLRKARAANGKRMFEADELRAMIEAAGVHLKAMILLGANCGFGQSDISNLPKSAVNPHTRWLDFPRPKTGVERRCPLWPETVSALQNSLAKRPDPSNEGDDDLVFITKYGNRWVRTTENDDVRKRGMSVDSVAQETRKLLKELDLKRGRLGFYALRHTFQTIGERSGDLPAVKAIMGHVDESMSGAYREGFEEARLLAVVDVIQDWLFTTDAIKRK